jgi:hypothetical protein
MERPKEPVNDFEEEAEQKLWLSLEQLLKMARNIVSVYIKPKRKSHPHSKNASVGQNKYKKPYRGQGR